MGNGANKNSRMTTSAAVSRASVGFRSERGPILISLMLATGLVAMDSTIIATAVRSIGEDLGDLEQFPWLFSIYLLTQAVSTPIYGKLADIVGRKPLMLWGIGLFLVASVACGFAWGMGPLIVFRALQGLGAGAVQPMAMTIAGDVYTVAERAAVTGYLSAVWGIAAVAGPAIGGFFSDFLTWRWIFFVNVPLCLLAAWMLLRSFNEKPQRRDHRIDYAGAVLITGGSSLVIIAVLQGGQTWPWASLPGIAIPVIGVAMLAGFVWAETRAAEPIVPLWVFSRRVLFSTSMTALAVGAITIGITAYIPNYVQGALGTSALVAGFALAPLSIGWPIFSTISGRIYMRIGFRTTALLGSIIVAGAMVSMLTLGAGSSPWTVALLCGAVGCGMGWIAGPSLIAAQASVGWSQRGVVTGDNMFKRSMGSALAVAVFGALANVGYHGVSADNADPVQIAAATHNVLIGAVVVVGLMVAMIFAMPPGRDTSQVVDG